MQEYRLMYGGDGINTDKYEHPLFRAIEDIRTYLEESESVGGEIDGWENLQKDLKDLWDKALEENFPND